MSTSDKGATAANATTRGTSETLILTAGDHAKVKQDLENTLIKKEKVLDFLNRQLDTPADSDLQEKPKLPPRKVKKKIKTTIQKALPLMARLPLMRPHVARPKRSSSVGRTPQRYNKILKTS
jgi:hypothetical protein